MAFMLPALASALGGLLFRKKGGKIVQQTSNGQAFMQAKPVALKLGGMARFNPMDVIKESIRKKKGGKVKKRKQKK